MLMNVAVRYGFQSKVFANDGKSQRKFKDRLDLLPTKYALQKPSLEYIYVLCSLIYAA